MGPPLPGGWESPPPPPISPPSPIPQPPPSLAVPSCRERRLRSSIHPHPPKKQLSFVVGVAPTPPTTTGGGGQKRDRTAKLCLQSMAAASGPVKERGSAARKSRQLSGESRASAAPIMAVGSAGRKLRREGDQEQRHSNGEGGAGGDTRGTTAPWRGEHGPMEGCGPTEGDTVPRRDTTPWRGGHSPVTGDAVPPQRNTVPLRGDITPLRGGTQPHSGAWPPQSRGETAPWQGTRPCHRECSPTEGCGPIKGGHSPTAGGRSPMTGDAALQRDTAPQSGGDTGVYSPMGAMRGTSPIAGDAAPWGRGGGWTWPHCRGQRPTGGEIAP